MTWNEVPHHHIQKRKDHEIMDCILSWHVVTKLHAMKNKLSFFFQFWKQKGFHTIHLDVHIYKLHLYKTSWKHTNVLTTKPFQNFINKEEKV
jgi:hypothetical protein